MFIFELSVSRSFTLHQVQHYTHYHQPKLNRMASKPQVILTANAPQPLPQFSQAIKFNGLVYCSGNIGMDPKTSKVIEGTVKDRTRQALNNLSAILQEAGSSLQNALKVNVFITTMDDFAAMNEAYDEFITGDTKPVRTCVAVKQLPFGTDVEIEVTAYIPRKESKL